MISHVQGQLIQELDHLLERGQYDDVLVMIDETRLDSIVFNQYTWHDQSKLLMLRAECLMESNKFQEAKTDYMSAYQILQNDPSDTLLSDWHNKYGLLFLEIGDLTTASQHFEYALTIRRNIFDTDHPKIADVYNNIGIATLLSGDVDQSLNYLNQSWSIRSKDPNTPIDKLAQSKSNLGLSYFEKGMATESLASYEQALSYYQTLGTAYHEEQADVILNQSLHFLNENMAQVALTQLNKAIILYESVDRGKHSNLALCYNNLGNAYSYLNNPVESKVAHVNALKLRQNWWGRIHPEVAESYYNLSILELNQGQVSGALALMDSALIALHYDPVDDVRRFDLVNQHQVLLQILYNKAELYRQLFEITGSTDILEESLLFCDELRNLLDYLRMRFQTIGSQLDLANTSHDICELAITICLMLFEETGQLKYKHFAFSYAEYGKGMMLFSSFQDNKAREFANIPTSRIQLIDSLEKQLAQLTQKIQIARQYELEQSASIDSLQQVRFNLNEQLRNSVADLEMDYPKYHDIRFQNPLPNITVIQNALQTSQQTFVSYFQGESTLFVFVISSTDFEVREVQLTDQYYPTLETYEQSIISFPLVQTGDVLLLLQNFTSSASSLYQNLLFPVQHLMSKRVVIFPDGPLYLIPFESLLVSDTIGSENLNDLDYLFRHHAISYGYSIQTWLDLNTDIHTNNKIKYVGFAPSFSETSAYGLDELGHNEEEVQHFKRVLGGKVYSASQATKQAFMKAYSDASVVHLATHGYVHPENNNLSFLAFANDENQDEESTFLYTNEIYALDNSIDLLILSACESGLGQVKKGEGMLSLARSFIFSGTKGIISTRWKIDDRKASELMGTLVSNLKNAVDKDIALQETLMTYMANNSRTYAHPFYWASFSLIGNTHPLPTAANPTLSLILITALFIVLIYLLFRKRRQQA